jgi:3-dehydroquinate synthase
MTNVYVPLGDRAYDVKIQSGLLAQSGQLIAPLLRRPKVWIVTESNVAGLHLQTLKAGLKGAEVDSNELILPPGETTKSWPYVMQTVEWLLEERVERNDIVIAFGGGVIGDLVGFCAAILRRGVRFVQIPTSLLAQVDSSVGGKTGINAPQGKNLIGAFHQPSLVLADIDLLGTLTKRDFLAGYGEVVKYGGLGDASFFEWLEINGPALAAGNQDLRTEAVRWSVQMKADIVARDETEQGDRALLNLGHTFAHALEAATGYGDKLLHGEAVAIGCGLAFETSTRMGLMSQEEPSRFRQHLAAMEMKKDISDIDADLPDTDGLIALMAQDKKVEQGRMTFILANSIGDAFVSHDIDTAVLKTVVDEALFSAK